MAENNGQNQLGGKCSLVFKRVSKMGQVSMIIVITLPTFIGERCFTEDYYGLVGNTLAQEH